MGRKSDSSGRKVGSVLITLAFVLSVLPAFALQAAANPDVTTVSVEPPTQTVDVDNTFTVDILVDPAVPIGGISLELHFDPSLVNATKVATGTLGSVNETEDFMLVVKKIYNDTGIVDLAGLIITGVNELSLPGTFAKITFVSMAAGTSGLTIEDLVVAEYVGADPVPVLSEAENGEVTVEGLVDETPPEPFELISPENDATVTTSTPTLEWGASSDSESGIDYYEVWLDESNVGNMSAPTTSYTASELDSGSHDWYIVAVNGVGLTTRSDSIFTFTVTPTPAKFEYSNLEISLYVLMPGENLTVSATVKNVGGAEGTENVKLYRDGKPIDFRPITLGPSDENTISFTRTFTGPALYTIDNLEPKTGVGFPWIDEDEDEVFDPGENAYPSIGSAVQAAENWDVIAVCGVYDTTIENFPITVDKPVTLVSIGGAKGTVIDGGGSDVLLIQADNVTIDGFTMTDGGRGVWLENSSGAEIKNNWLESCGVFIEGTDVSRFNSHVIENNTVNGKPVYYFADETGIVVPDDAGEVILANCSDVIIEGVDASNGSIGAEIAYSDNVTISHSTFHRNSYAGVFLYSGNNTLENIDASSNRYGILLSGSDHNTLQDIVASKCGEIGIYMAGSNYNTVRNLVTNYNGSMGMGIYGSSYVVVDNWTSSRNGGYGGRSGTSGSHNVISNFVANHNGVDGFRSYDWADSKFLNCYFSQNGEKGILFKRADNNLIANCYAEGGAHTGFGFEAGCHDTVVDNCTVVESKEGVFFHGGCNNNTVKNCHITSCPRLGIGFEYNSGGTAINNTCTSCGDGVMLMGSSNNTVENNVVTSSVSNGIHVRESSNNNTILRNTVENNPNGIRISGSGGNVFNYNNVVGNGSGLVNAGWDTVDATLNWWGDPSGPSGVGLGKGDSVSANVEYIPWLDASYPGGKPVVAEVQVIEGTAEVSLRELAPEVLSVVPSEPDWDPWGTYMVTVTIRDNNGLGDLNEVVLVAYTGDAAIDSTKNRYTWWFDPADNSWHSSLGDEFIDSANCSAPDNLSEIEGEYVFAIRLAKTAKPGTWDMCARAVDSHDMEDTLKIIEAITVRVYTEFSLDRYTLNFKGVQGETVAPELGPSVVTVTTNERFDIRVRMSSDWTVDGLTMPMDTTTANGITLTDEYQTILENIGYGEDVESEIDWVLAIPLAQELGEYHTTFYVNVAH